MVEVGARTLSTERKYIEALRLVLAHRSIYLRALQYAARTSEPVAVNQREIKSYFLDGIFRAKAIPLS